MKKCARGIKQGGVQQMPGFKEQTSKTRARNPFSCEPSVSHVKILYIRSTTISGRDSAKTESWLICFLGGFYMDRKYFNELARILAKQGIKSTVQREDNLTLLLDGLPACHVGAICQKGKNQKHMY
jgi:hypothetical protein